MHTIRASEIATHEGPGFRLELLANPRNGAEETALLRGIVDPGGSFPPHSHDREEVLYFLSGSATFTIGDETGSASAGDVIVIPAGALHTFETTEGLDAVAALPAAARTFAPDGIEMTR